MMVAGTNTAAVRGTHQGGDERVRRAKNTILFIDELHTLVGAGGRRAIDASNVLKPARRAAKSSASAPRPSTSTASTSRRTARWIALPVVMVEPSTKKRRGDIEGAPRRYEQHHHVRITNDALTRPLSCRAATSPAAACRQGHRLIDEPAPAYT